MAFASSPRTAGRHVKLGAVTKSPWIYNTESESSEIKDLGFGEFGRRELGSNRVYRDGRAALPSNTVVG